MANDWSNFLVKGIPVPSGAEVPQRQDFRDFSEKQQYLYVEGLKRFQHVDFEKPLGDMNPKSYFKIAGIHGKPYESWPYGHWEDIPKKKDTGEFEGFCTHTSILFLTWHRPYLALFESELYKHVREIANGIEAESSVKQEYVALAENFRLPYWDWAHKDIPIAPLTALDPNYRVQGPPSSGSVPPRAGDYNPLYEFPLPKNCPEDIPIGHSKSTIRYPKRNPIDPNDNILAKLRGFYERPSDYSNQLPKLKVEHNLSERTAYILLAYRSFVAMSHNKFRKDNTGKGSDIVDKETWGSLEEIHNALHDLIGGGGHMSSFALSAFDPIFWLHHANIDRLFAIWQALHEDNSNDDSFILTRSTDVGNFATKAGEAETIENELYPFRPDVASWWRSKQVKRTEVFGYTYPETAGLKYPTSPADKTALMKKLGKIYVIMPELIRESQMHIKTAGADLLPQAHIVAQVESKKVPATVAKLEDLVQHLPSPEILLENSLKPSKPVIRDLAPGNKYLEWITNIKAEKHTLDGAYSVHIFLGDPAESNTALWPAAPTHVGTFAPLGQTGTTRCGKCQEDQRDHTQVTGQIPLTIALVERYLAGLIPDLTVDSVVPYLTKHLHWRVAKGDGTILQDRSQVRGLKVLVISNEVTIPEDDSQLPIYAPDVTVHPRATTNRDEQGRGDGTGLSVHDWPS